MNTKKVQCKNCNWYSDCHLEKRLPCLYFENQSLTQTQVEHLKEEVFEIVSNSIRNEDLDVLEYLDDFLSDNDNLKKIYDI